tara:strand:+ start:141 stop:965 length:825 start_codon:yes stop_codon:yes gene_type:complete
MGKEEKAIPFDAIRKRNIANILTKVKAGKSLTTSEQRTLDDEEARAKGKREKRTIAQMSKEYHAAVRTINRWVKLEAPFEDDQAMNAFVMKQKHIPKEFIKWQLSKGFTKLEETTDEEIGDQFESQVKLRDFYFSKLSGAAKRNDQNQIKYWNELLLKTEESMRRTEAHQKKFDLESGETIDRAEVQRILAAVIYAGNVCVRSQIKEIAEVLAAESSPAQIYEILSPAILGGRIFEGFKTLTKSESQVKLPMWVVECVQSEGENYLEGVDVAAK